MKILFVMFILFISKISIVAQTIEDAVRFATPNGYITARSGALGISYSGISDDYAALYYNPAGLSLLSKSELSIGLEFMRMNTSTKFIQENSLLSSSFVSPTNVGFVFPFKTENRIASIAFGYNYESSFDNTMEFSGFNSSSSIVQSLANETTDFIRNLAYQIFLADTIGGRGMRSPIFGNVQQSGFISERGGIHSFTGGGAFSLSSAISVGFNLSGKWGTYQYSNEFKEADSKNYYQVNDRVNFNSVDFTSLTLNSDINQQFSGFSALFGLQGRFDNSVRYGVTIKSPTLYSITETSSRTISATFDNGENISPKYPDSLKGQNSYKIISPFVFGVSLSYHYQWITLSAAAEYNDLTQLRFDGQTELLRINNQILKTLNGSLTYSIGLECDIPSTSVVIRAGYSRVTASYINDILGAEQKILGIGAGFYLAPNIRLDMLARFNSFSQPRANYTTGTDSQFIYTSSPVQVSTQFVYRY